MPTSKWIFTEARMESLKKAQEIAWAMRRKMKPKTIAHKALHSTEKQYYKKKLHSGGEE